MIYRSVSYCFSVVVDPKAKWSLHSFNPSQGMDSIDYLLVVPPSLVRLVVLACVWDKPAGSDLDLEWPVAVDSDKTSMPEAPAEPKSESTDHHSEARG